MARLARGVVAFVALVGLGAAGCRNRPTHKRTGDAAPVEILTAPVIPDGGAQASEEVEPNDADDVATVLALGATVHGKIDPEPDVDRYRIDVTSAGALTVMVEPHDALDAALKVGDATGARPAAAAEGGRRRAR